ncbi:Glycoside-hydrolase family GH114 [Chitinophaga sp. CF118]|uniref:endo alpha-1,4 polygalactosaminidase n=1 Tax=Chitinophaga sp. CF118 TaxID=1884367 RepID=UPI0008F07779|nr:endo alpha-1,4 polygalactosaminidase [Chitinophaga sp. CF118]SFD89464.1 Glycoside-hydrolase family GH114 [Chitinophaga sp. CF118]
MSKTFLFAFLLVIAMSGCTKKDTTSKVDPINNSDTTATWWQPVAGVTFDWDLADVTSSDTFFTDVVDVDAFQTSQATVAALHAKGKKVIAYVSVGTLENYRDDGNLLPAEVIGNVYPEWPDERWLNIHQLDKIKPWLISRFTMIRQKGFDAIEPDNLDAYENETGFDITLTDTKNYCSYLIELAHSMGLGIGQKNVPELTDSFSLKFDWALTEDAFDQGWQDDMLPYISKNKPVFVTEYSDVTSQTKFQTVVCPAAKTKKFSAVFKKRELDKWSYFCQ